MKLLLPLLLVALATQQLRAADTDAAATAINSLGIDLLKKAGNADENALLSPYSIQEALAMTYAGAVGKTREEMMKTLHFPKDDKALYNSFLALEDDIVAIQQESEKAAKNDHSQFSSGPKLPVTITVANRRFGQAGFEFPQPIIDVSRGSTSFTAPVEELDFKSDPDKAREHINDWVAEQTHKRIVDLIPDGAITNLTRFVLVNAIYLKAQWHDCFKEKLTEPGPFHINGGAVENLPMMHAHGMHLGLEKREGYTAVAIPYTGSQLQFVILLPDKANGLAALEAKLTAAMLAGCAKLPGGTADISLPKFKLDPPMMDLNKPLQALGMETAFGAGADFGGMSPQQLWIQDIFHKTFLSVDENGTEAAAGTAVKLINFGGDEPDTVNIDHPFLFAIQDRKSGACLFMGRVSDPGGGAE